MPLDLNEPEEWNGPDPFGEYSPAMESSMNPTDQPIPDPAADVSTPAESSDPRRPTATHADADAGAPLAMRFVGCAGIGWPYHGVNGFRNRKGRAWHT